MINELKHFPKIEDVHTIVFDFDGVFTDNKVYVNQDGLEFVMCDRRDGLAIDLLRKFQTSKQLLAKAFVLSTETNSVVVARAKKLKLPCYTGIRGKLDFLEDYFSERFQNTDSPFEGLVYLGNDLNDLAVIAKAGYSVVPSDAHPMIKSMASVVLSEKGGDAFVRAFIELFLGMSKLNTGEINELIFNS